MKKLIGPTNKTIIQLKPLPKLFGHKLAKKCSFSKTKLSTTPHKQGFNCYQATMRA